MSYVALITNRFDEVIRFYGEGLGFAVVDQWDRPDGRGHRFEVGGLRLEILDNMREQHPLTLEEPHDRFHVVIEVDDLDQARDCIKMDVPPTRTTSWGARLFQVRDPDSIPVTFLQWVNAQHGPCAESDKLA